MGLTKISLVTLESASESDELHMEMNTDLETDVLEKQISTHLDVLSTQEQSAGATVPPALKRPAD